MNSEKWTNTSSTSTSIYNDNDTSSTSSSHYLPYWWDMGSTGSGYTDGNGNTTCIRTYYDEYGNKYEVKIVKDRYGNTIDFERTKLGNAFDSKNNDLRRVWTTTNDVLKDLKKKEKDKPNDSLKKKQEERKVKNNKEENNDSVDFPNNKQYNETNCLNKEEGKSMSLVGLFRCDNGIIGVGDYKSTRTLNNFSTEEKDRDTQKVFKNDKFIMVTHNTNTIVINNTIMRLEDFINSILKDGVPYNVFFNEFAKYTNQTDTIYYFIIGIKEEDYLIYEVYVSKGKIEKYIINNYYDYGGDSKYFNVMKTLSIDFTKDVYEVAKKLEKAFKALIEFYSVEDVYQSIGTNSKGEICVEVFKG